MKRKGLVVITTSIVMIMVGGILVGMNKCYPIKEYNIAANKSQIRQDTCNQKQTYGKSIKVPKEVCMPLKHVISYIYPSVDLDGDGLKDLMLRHREEVIENGDSMFLSIYLQNVDGSYRLAKDLPNIYPIYFETYEYSKELYNSLNPKLKKIRDIYIGNPLGHLYFEKGEIELWMNVEAHVDYKLHFIYNKDKDTWVLHKWEEYTDYNNVIIEREIPEGWKLLIEDFDYMDYLDW